MENKTKEQILYYECMHDIYIISLSYPKLYVNILTAMEKYSEQNCDKIQELFSKPAEQLKPLEDLYRKENPRPDGKFYVPDATEFYKWIRIKILGK